jgi:hypothetical protein
MPAKAHGFALERIFTSAPRISLSVVQTSSGEPPSQSADCIETAAQPKAPICVDGTCYL